MIAGYVGVQVYGLTGRQIFIKERIGRDQSQKGDSQTFGTHRFT